MLRQGLDFKVSGDRFGSHVRSRLCRVHGEPSDAVLQHFQVEQTDFILASVREEEEPDVLIQ